MFSKHATEQRFRTVRVKTYVVIIPRFTAEELLARSRVHSSRSIDLFLVIKEIIQGAPISSYCIVKGSFRVPVVSHFDLTKDHANPTLHAETHKETIKVLLWNNRMSFRLCNKNE